jgi:hypothetical protein
MFINEKLIAKHRRWRKEKPAAFSRFFLFFKKTKDIARRVERDV